MCCDSNHSADEIQPASAQDTGFIHSFIQVLHSFSSLFFRCGELMLLVSFVNHNNTQ